MAVRLPVPAASRLVEAMSSGPGVCLLQSLFSPSSGNPCMGLALWPWRTALSVLWGWGGKWGCTPAVGVSGVSFPALTSQLIPGASHQVGSREPQCAHLPPSPAGAHCSVPVGSVPGKVAFPSQPCTAGHSADSLWVSCLCPSAASAELLAGWGWSGCLSASAPACVQPCAWNSFPNLQIR